MMKYFLSMLDRKFGAKVKCIRSDNALELGGGTTSSEFYASEGMIQQTSWIETP